MFFIIVFLCVCVCVSILLVKKNNRVKHGFITLFSGTTKNKKHLPTHVGNDFGRKGVGDLLMCEREFRAC